MTTKDKNDGWTILDERKMHWIMFDWILGGEKNSQKGNFSYKENFKDTWGNLTIDYVTMILLY